MKTTEAELALEAVLLFHGGGEWDQQKRDRWQYITQTVLGHCTDRSAYGGHVDDWEATTRVLCDLARVALGQERRRV